MSVTQTHQLTATVIDANGQPIESAPIAFVSGDTAIVTVSASGLVRGVGDGFSVVAVISGTLSANVPVLVAAQVPDTILVSPDVVTLFATQSQQLTATVEDTLGFPIANPPLLYESSDTMIAVVSASGSVTAVRGGTAFVTVRFPPSLTTFVAILVNGPASLTLSVSQRVFVPPASVAVTAIVQDRQGSTLLGQNVTYTSLDPTVATVDPQGLVTLTGYGDARIVGAIGLLRDTVTVTGIVARTQIGGRPFAAATSSADVAYVTLLTGNALARFDPPGAAPTAQPAVGLLPTGLTFNNAGTRVYTANQGAGTVSVVDVTGDTTIATLPAVGGPFAVAVPPGDSLIYVSTNAARIDLIRISSGAVLDSIMTGSTPVHLLVSGSSLFASLTDGGVVHEISMSTNAILRTFAVSGRPQGMATTPNGDLYVAREHGPVVVYSLATGSRTDSIPLPGGGGFAITRDPTSGHLYVTTAFFGVGIHIINPATKAVIRTISTRGDPRGIALTTTGMGIVANHDGWVDFIR